MSLAYQAQQIEDALNASFGAGAARVDLATEATGARRVFDITWTGPAGGQPQSVLTAVASSADVAVTQRALVTGAQAQGSVQAIRLYDGTATGTFELYVQVGGQEYTTRQLAFDASAATVREALLASTNDAGESLLSTGASLAVALIDTGTADAAWQVTFGGALLNTDVPTMQGLITSVVSAPDAQLVLEALGTTTQARQVLDFSDAGPVVRLSVAGSDQVSALVETASLDAATLKAALVSLDRIGGADAITVRAGDAANTYVIDYAGVWADRAVPELRVHQVQSFDLSLAGTRADALAYRIAGDDDFSADIDLSVLTDDAVLDAVQALLATANDVAPETIAVSWRNAATHRLDVTVLGALAGATIPSFELLLSRQDQVKASELLIGATNVSASIGSAAAGATLASGELAMVVTETEDGDIAYALNASGTAGLTGFGGDVSLSASASLAVNAMGQAISVTVPTGVSTSKTVTFADGLARSELTITNGNLTVAGLGTLGGDLKLITTQSEASGITTTDVRIGVINAEGELTLGGAEAELSAGTAGIVLRHEQTAAGAVTTRYAVEAGGNISITAGASGTGIALTATDLRVGYNRWGADLAMDVETPSDVFQLDLIDNETRLSGQMTATVAGALEISGQLFIENREDQTVVLEDGTTVATDQLILGGQDISIEMGPDGAALSLTDVDVAMVLATSRADNTKQWLTLQGSLGGASIAGNQLARINSAEIQINRALSGGTFAAATDTVIDWDAAPLAIALTPTEITTFAMDDHTFVMPIDAVLEVGGARLSGAFTVSYDATADAWSVVTDPAKGCLSDSGQVEPMSDLSQ